MVRLSPCRQRRASAQSRSRSTSQKQILAGPAQTTRALQEGTVVADSRTRALPGSVRELVAGRLEHLSARARELASVAAAFGRAFDFRLLQRAGVLDEHTTAEGLEELVRRHVLGGVGEGVRLQSRSGSGPSSTISCSPSFSPEAAPPPGGRGAGNAPCWKSGAAPGGPGGSFPRRRGVGPGRRLLPARRGLCQRAQRLQRGRGLLRQALGALEHLPESPETIRLPIDLHRDLHSGHLLLGELPRMLDSLREAERLAKGLGDAHRLARVSAHLTACCWWMGQFETGVEYAQQALDTARSVAISTSRSSPVSVSA